MERQKPGDSGTLSSAGARRVLKTGSCGLVWAGAGLLIVTAMSDNVQAYIDPGTGSYAFQLAIAGALAALYTLKRYWGSIKSMLRRHRPVPERREAGNGRNGELE